MRETWEYELAREFKKRNNKTPLGPCIGKVLSLTPVQIGIQASTTVDGLIDNWYRLEADQIYICNQILERETTFQQFVANQSQAGDISVSCKCGGGKYTADGDIQAAGKVHLDEVWKVGDYVMVVPAENGQYFFIVDILRGVT